MEKGKERVMAMRGSRAAVSVVCGMCILTVLTNGLIALRRHREQQRQVYSIQSIQPDIPAARYSGEEEYILKVQDGRLAVFRRGDAHNPVQTTDIHIGSLRNYDRSLLEGGITVRGADALARILEDFGS